MNILFFIAMIRDIFVDLLGVLDAMIFTVGDVTISYLSVIFGCLILLMILAVFWKGARA